jgi:hypothetical protein
MDVRVFHCDHCGHLLFFENTTCVQCGRQVAYLPDLALMGSLDPAGDGVWRSPLPAARNGYRLCRNYTNEQVCNWAVTGDEANPLCVSCRLTRVIPDLARDGHRQAWYRLEVAKRRVIFTLMRLHLPIVSRDDDPERGLAFEFKSDMPGGPGPVLTGHTSGVITINVAEADDAERERRRMAVHEPYRTLLGHMRHEIGHYYWDRLVKGSAAIGAFRDYFGDEQRDYAAALSAHYDDGPPADWQERFVSAYASAHPWEDWAETWAHYLHIVDALETAADCGLSLRPSRRDEPSMATVPSVPPSDMQFEELIDRWFPLTYALNNFNRGLGLSDAYPFVLSASAVQKLRYVFDTVNSASTTIDDRSADRNEALPAT